MKYFYIVTNRFKDPDGVNTRKIAHFLRSKGAECVCQIEQEQAFNKTGSYSDVRLVPDNTECVIVLGALTSELLVILQTQICQALRRH